MNIYNDWNITFLITKSSRLILKHYIRELKKLKISPVQSGILAILNSKKELSFGEICQILIIEKVSASRMLSNLENMGLVEKIIDCNDKRKYNFQLSQTGLDMIPKINEINTNINKKVEETFPNANIDEFRNNLINFLNTNK